MAAAKVGIQLMQNQPAEVLFQRNRAAMEMLFNRPSTLNTLNNAMKAAIVEMMPNLARDPELYALVIGSTNLQSFSTGNDMRELINLSQNNIDDARISLARFYTLSWALNCLSKPTLALIKGTVMGSGIGLTYFCTHRVAAEQYKLAMPETSLGFFPDAGIAHVLANLPNSIGFYLALTGRAISRRDAYTLGFVTHCISACEFEEIVNELADAQPIDPLLDRRHQDPGAGELITHYECISEAFSAPNIDQIVARLERKRTDYHSPEWIDSVLKDLNKCSPTALAVTHRHLQRSSALNLRENLIADYSLACNFLQCKDFNEGMKLFLIDKHVQPQWDPGELSGINNDAIDWFFSEIYKDKLSLPCKE